jgi:hypothetical protein
VPHILGCAPRQVNEGVTLLALRWHSMRGQKETPDSFPFRLLLKAFFALRLIGGTHEFVAAFAGFSNQHLDFFDFPQIGKERFSGHGSLRLIQPQSNLQV